MANALLTIARKEGALTLYRGLTATVGGAAPYTGLKFATYAQVKLLLSEFMGTYVAFGGGRVMNGTRFQGASWRDVACVAWLVCCCRHPTARD